MLEGKGKKIYTNKSRASYAQHTHQEFNYKLEERGGENGLGGESG